MLTVLQMEAVGAFIEGCKSYGLTEKDCCVTLDIYEKQAGDQNMVRIERERERKEGGCLCVWGAHLLQIFAVTSIELANKIIKKFVPIVQANHTIRSPIIRIL